MKLMHVHAKSSVEVRLPEPVLGKLPAGRWGIVTTVQHLHRIGDVLAQLKNAVLGGQVIGCNASEAEKIKDSVDQWLFVGSGEFHPLQVALKTGQKVWLWNPVSKEFGLLDSSVVEKYRKQKSARVSLFLSAKKVGVIVSTKIGQKNLMRALELAEMADREYYVFACDELDMLQFANFSFIDYWVNTACPRIPDSSVRMVNIDELIDAGILKLEKESFAYEVPIWIGKLGVKKTDA